MKPMSARSSKMMSSARQVLKDKLLEQIDGQPQPSLPPPDYSKQPTPHELKAIENWEAIDAQSNKGWGRGGEPKKEYNKFSNALKAEVFDRIYRKKPTTSF